MRTGDHFGVVIPCTGRVMDTDRTSSDADNAMPPPASDFRIGDAESANWLVRKVVEARAYRAVGGT